MTHPLEELRAAALTEIAAAADEQALDAVRVRYLGRSGSISAWGEKMKGLSKEEKPVVGKLLNEARGVVTAEIEAASEKLRTAGEANALEILLEGRVFDAAEAKEKGLVTRVVADDQVEAEAQATARRIADGAPLVARWHKKFARRLRDPKPLTNGEYLEGFDCFGTEDFQIGYQAFLAKQKPEFKGK